MIPNADFDILFNQILNKILEVNSYTFTMDLAVIASRRDLLVLDQWLKNRIAVGQDNFVKACLDYISEGLRHDSLASSRKDLPVETIAIFLQVLLAR